MLSRNIEPNISSNKLAVFIYQFSDIGRTIFLAESIEGCISYGTYDDKAATKLSVNTNIQNTQYS